MAAQTNTHVCIMPPSRTDCLALHSRSACSLTDLFIYAWQAADWRDRENHVTWFLHFSKSWSNSYVWGDPRGILKRQKCHRMLAKEGGKGLDEQVKFTPSISADYSTDAASLCICCSVLAQRRSRRNVLPAQSFFTEACWKLGGPRTGPWHKWINSSKNLWLKYVLFYLWNVFFFAT